MTDINFVKRMHPESRLCLKQDETFTAIRQKQKTVKKIVGVSLILLSAINISHAADSKDAAKLGSQLTPAGADISASADGSIPAWSAPGGQAVSGWAYGKLRKDYWKYKDDKPLFTIDASNVDKYADKLNPGFVEMFKRIKDYHMVVYPSRRSCGIPDFVADNTKKNIGFAKLDAEGFSLQEAYLPGIPFPIPSNGVEVMWNAKMRYRGLAYNMPKDAAGISPRKGSNDWMRITTDMIYFTPWGEKSTSLFSKHDRVELQTYFNYIAPTAMAGQSGTTTSKAGSAAEVFYYFPGQRRVRRMPSFSYDAPQIGMDNQYTVDESAVFSGMLDRFNWKLLGKQEFIVPYNSFGMFDFKAKPDDVSKRDFIAPEYRRYEAHRVWVVEATVRQGMRHQAPKRIFYIDEDSWNLVAAVDYDASGRVWKVREGHLIPAYETGTCDTEAMVQYNLADGRYLYDSTSIGAGTDNQWITEQGNDHRLKRDFYTSDNLRAISER